MKFLIYDPITGHITGRITSSRKLEDGRFYPYRKIVTEDEFNSQPEFFQKIDVVAKEKTLVPLTEAEARSKGATETLITAKIAEGKLEVNSKE